MVGVCVVIASSDHGLDVACLGINGDQGHLQILETGIIERLFDRVFGLLLNRRVDSRLDGEAALKDDVARELLRQELTNVINEIRIRIDINAAGGCLAHVERNRLGFRFIAFLLGDVTQTQHVVENLVAAIGRILGVSCGIIKRWRVGQAD